eukprot:jgi/Chrzof1/1254/Cz01g46140.t1
MGFGQGVLWSLAGACAHTGIDALRKLGSGRIRSADLVTLAAVFDAVICTLFVAVFEGVPTLSQVEHPRKLTLVAFISGFLLLLSKWIYQRALHTAPLSLTVPYLAFTPAILVVVAYFFIGEVPTPMGLIGVSIVTLGGYLLALKTAPAPACGSPSKKPRQQDSSKLVNSQQTTVSSDHKSAWAVMFYKNQRPRLVDVEQQSAHTGAADAASKVQPYSPKVRLQSLHSICHNQLPQLWDRSDAASAGPVMILTVAALWSVTASLDKIGIMAASNLAVYFVIQRWVIGATSLGYLLLLSRPAFKHVFTDFTLLFSISTLELLAVVFFLQAIQNLLVSYVVAVKRINVLFSTLVGCFMFKESVGSRIPYILIMLSGMVIIVLQPGHELLHHSHHT